MHARGGAQVQASIRSAAHLLDATGYSAVSCVPRSRLAHCRYALQGFPPLLARSAAAHVAVAHEQAAVGAVSTTAADIMGPSRRVDEYVESSDGSSDSDGDHGRR